MTKPSSAKTAAIYIGPQGSLENSSIVKMKVRGSDHAILNEGKIAETRIEDLDFEAMPAKQDKPRS